MVRIVFGLLLVCALSFAQSERGTILGTVSDPTGAVIAGAKVTITNVATNVKVLFTTTDAGDYSAPSLSAGVYNLRIERDGFRPTVINGVTLNASSSIRADAKLELGSSAQAIEVQAQSLALSTDSSKQSATVENKLVDQLPLVVAGAMRSPFDLANLTPEAKPLGGDNGFMLGGGQAGSYGTNLDGVSANTTRALSQSWVAVNAPSVEAITEFTVDTNGFKAEYGHAGGGMMNFVSKSGTNELHGSAYEYLRNNVLDANNFFNNAAGSFNGGKALPRKIYKQNDFGASVGGPVWIPKVYNGKNKTFFFFSYEAFRNRNGANGSSATIPTPEMLTGDFTNWVDATGKQIAIFDPTSQTTDASGKVTRQPFAGNKIPASKWDSVSTAALKAFTANGSLAPNNGALPGSINYIKNNFLITSGTTVEPQTKVSIKGDHVFNDRHRISGYYGYNSAYQEPGPNGPATLPGLFTNFNDLQRKSDVVRFSWDWTISPTKLNHFYAGGNNWRENHDPPQATVKSGVNWKDKVCLANVPNCAENLLNLDFSNGYTSWGGRANNGSENTIYSYNDDFTWIKGAHQIKIGGMYQLSHYNGLGRQCIAGCATFSFLNTAQAGDSSQGTGNPFASFLLGYANGGSIDTVRFIGQQWPYYAGYIQDDWRVNRKLSINYGLRWETTLPPTGLDDKWSDFSPTRPNPRAGGILGALIYAGNGTGREGSRSLADSWWGGYGPRFGFAYTLNDKTVIRGGIGRSFSAITTVSGSTHQRGFTQTYGVPDNGTNGVQPNMVLGQGFPSYPIPPFIDPSFANKDNIPWWQGKEATRAPEANSWNLSIQRQLSGKSMMEVSYNAVAGSHLQSQLLNINQVNPKYLAQYGSALLNTRIDNPAVVATGVTAPYPNFIADWGSGATLSRALRAYPQYGGIDTYAGGGDHSGHSAYHAGIIRYNARDYHGATIQTSYAFSKIITDSDSYWGSGTAIDQYNRRLEKSIGQFDITHNFKLAVIYELPFGKGKAYLNKGVGNLVLGGWRLSSIHYYASGQPLMLGTTTGVQGLFVSNNRPLISTYDGWSGATNGFDPGKDRFVQPASYFPTQRNDAFSNATRYNPKFRQFPNLNENISFAKTFSFSEKVRMDFRAEMFNAFNRVRFGTGSLTLQDQNLGKLVSASDLLNTPRQMQMGLKLYF